MRVKWIVGRLGKGRLMGIVYQVIMQGWWKSDLSSAEICHGCTKAMLRRGGGPCNS